MVVAIQSVACGNAASLSANGSITKPTGTANGDLLLAIVTTFSATPTTMSIAGFSTMTKISGMNVWVGHKIAASEGISYTMNRTGSTAAVMAGAIYRITGHDSGNPIDVINGIHDAANNTTLTIPSVTVTTGGLLVSGFFKNGNIAPTSTQPSGMTFGADDSTPNNSAFAWAYETVSAGATGTKMWTSSSNALAGAAHVVINDATVLKSGSETGSVAISETSSLAIDKSTTDTGSVAISESSSVVPEDAPPSSSDSASLAILETSNVNPLGTFHTAFTDRNTSRVNIGMLGASIVEGAKAPLSKSIEVKLSKKLRSLFSTTGSGWGYVGIPSSQVYATGLTQITWSGGTYNELFGFGEHHGVWLSTFAAGGVITFTNPEQASSITLSTFKWAFGSATGGQYRINGGSWTTFNTYNASTQMQDISITGPFNAGDTIDVKHGGGDGSSLYISGFIHYNGDETAGLHVHNFGHFGYTTNEWMYASSGYPQWTNEIVAHDLDLLIVSDIGANDAAENGGKTSAQVKTDYFGLLNRIRTDGYSGPLLLVSVYDFSFGYPTLEPWANYVQVIKEVAKEYGAAYLDLNAVMPPTPNAIYHADNIHTNANGDANELIAGYLLKTMFPDSDLPNPQDVTDTSSVSISETSSLFKTITASDTGSLEISETQTSNSTLGGTDTSSVAIAETSSMSVNVSVSDTSSVAISETNTLTKSITSDDTGAVGIDETSDIYKTVFLSTTDTGSVAVSEINTLSLTKDAVDSGSVSISESHSEFVTVTSNDGASVSVADPSLDLSVVTDDDDVSSVAISESTSVVILDEKSTIDSGTIAVSESMSIVTTSQASETNSLAISETTSFVKNIEAVDSGTVSISETSTIDVSLSRTETSATTITETAIIAKSSSTTDTGSISIVDSSQTLVTSSRTDTDSIAISESSSAQSTGQASDTASLSISESQNILVSISSNDSSSVTISEESSSGSDGTGNDSSSVSISEDAAVQMEFSAADTSSLSISDVSSSEGINADSDDDTGSIEINETSSLLALLTVNDDVTISISESNSTMSTGTSSDAGSLAIGETNSQSRNISVVDSSTIAITDDSELARSVDSTETSSISVAESTSTNVSLDRTDTSSVSLAEGSSTAVTSASSDSANIQVSESASIRLDLSGTDSSALAVSESSSIQSVNALTVSDTSAVVISESTEFVKNIQSTDSSSIIVGETTSNSATGNSVDTSTMSVSEATSIVKSFTSNDSSALSIIETNERALTVTADDTGSLAVSESSEFETVRYITSIDNVTISVSEVTAYFREVMASDTSSIRFIYNTSISGRDEVEDKIIRVSPGGTKQTGYLETETFTGTMVRDSISREKRTEGDSETIQRLN